MDDFLFRLFFLFPPTLPVTFALLLTTVTAIRAAVRGGRGTDSVGHASKGWIAFRLGLAGFAVLIILSYPYDTSLHNGFRAYGYAILVWCILQFGLYWLRLRLAKRDTVRESRRR